MKPILIASGLLLALASFSAHATLGQSADSTTADSAQLHARLAKAGGASFSVHTLTTPDGIVVNEYVNIQGVVFAVRWSGPWRPDLSQLLGAYYADYLGQSTAAPKTVRGPIHLTRDDLVIQTSGHAGALSGLAYLPQQMPVGVTPNDLN